MKVFYGLTHFKPQNTKPAVALGVFDGLHRGHQRIISRLIKEAKRLRTTSLIVTFFPHPQKENSLYSLSHRLKLLEAAGVDACLVIRFNSTFRAISATAFINHILIVKINPAIVFIGRNFTFGRNAQGNWRTLRDYSKKAKFKLRVVDVLTYRGLVISSSRIRKLIKRGDFNTAQKLLGRPVSIFGRVTGGCGLGRTLGYPTANITPDQETFLPFGVYAVKVKMFGGYFSGICYIGNKPTLNPRIKRPKGRKASSAIEVHVFNFKNNLYGQRIQVDFVKRLRPEKRFCSMQRLACQIKSDILNCHKALRF